MAVPVMRIIAGSSKGRRLIAPRGRSTRPMTDRAREALFSSLGGLVAGARVLDLYAGTGSLGLEALSRGATDATFVERDRAALAALAANVEAIGLGGTVVAGNVDAYLEGAAGEYDVVFVDPPYADDAMTVDGVLAALDGLLAEGATVVVHRRTGQPPPEAPPGTELLRRRRYGDSELSVFGSPS